MDSIIPSEYRRKRLFDSWDSIFVLDKTDLYLKDIRQSKSSVKDEVRLKSISSSATSSAKKKLKLRISEKKVALLKTPTGIENGNINTLPTPNGSGCKIPSSSKCPPASMPTQSQIYLDTINSQLYANHSGNGISQHVESLFSEGSEGLYHSFSIKSNENSLNIDEVGCNDNESENDNENDDNNKDLAYNFQIIQQKDIQKDSSTNKLLKRMRSDLEDRATSSLKVGKEEHGYLNTLLGFTQAAMKNEKLLFFSKRQENDFTADNIKEESQDEFKVVGIPEWLVNPESSPDY